MPKVESDVVAWIDHNPKTQQLVVGLNNGKRYAYFMVPRRVYEDFLAAGSKGRFFNLVIKPNYPFRELA